VFSPTDSVSNGNISCSLMLAVVVGMQSMAVFFTSVYSFMDIVKSEIVSCCKNCDCDNLFFNFLIYLHVFL